MNKIRRNKQSGFSLVEAVLVTVLMLFVFMVFGSFMMRFTKSAAQYNEIAKQTADSGLTTQTITDDVEQTATNMTFSSKQSFTGKIFVPFQSYSGYNVQGNRISISRGQALHKSLLANSNDKPKHIGCQDTHFCSATIRGIPCRSLRMASKFQARGSINCSTAAI